MLSPLLYLNPAIRNQLFGIFPNIAQNLQVSSAIADNYEKFLDSNIKAKTVFEDWPINILGNKFYYEGEFGNGTIRITWNGNTLTPLNIKLQFSEEGWDVNYRFSFDSMDWTWNAIYLGYSLKKYI